MPKSNASFTWASQAFIEQQKLVENGEIPIWAPPIGEGSRRDVGQLGARRGAEGLRFRDLDTTIKDTLAWHNQRPADQKASCARPHRGTRSRAAQALVQA